MSRREETQRRKVLKKLQEQISTCTDPKLLIRLTNQYNDLLTKHNKAEKAQPVEEPAPTGRPANLPREKTSSAVDNLSDGDYRVHLVVVRTEKITRSGIPQKQAIQQALSELVAEGVINAEDFKDGGC